METVGEGGERGTGGRMVQGMHDVADACQD